MNKIKYIIIVIICLFLGFAGMYALVYFFPNTIIKSVTKEEVTIQDTGIGKSVEKVYDAVIYISATVDGSASTGTGFVYKKDKKYGYVITNYHVVEDADEIKVMFSDDSEVNAKYLGGDEYADIAVLAIDKDNVKRVAEMGKSTETNIGDTVFTIGAPMGLDYKGTVTKGILSGKDRMVSVSLNGASGNDWVMNVMQTDAAINPGNSGGPLCNVNGEVIGVNSLKIVKNEVEGLGFSIPIEDALSYAEKIEKGEDTTRPYLGVSLLDVTDSYQLAYSGIKLDKSVKSGAVITSVEKGSPASDGGIKTGDVIIEVGNEKIENVAEFRFYLYKYNPKDKVSLTVNRNGKEKKISVKLEKAE